MSRAKQVGIRMSGKKPTNTEGSQMSGKSIRTTVNSKSSQVAKSRFKPGALALREIRKYQKSSELLIKKNPFRRFVKYLSPFSSDIRFQSTSLLVLQEATENFITNLFEDAYKCALHAKRVTLMPKDIILIYKIKYADVIHTSMV